MGEFLYLHARLAVYKIRIADSFLSTDRGRYLYWVDAALGTLNWGLLPEGAYARPTLPRPPTARPRSLQRQPPHPERSGAAAAVPRRCGPRLAGRLSERGPRAQPKLRLRTAGLRVCQDDGIQRGLPASRVFGNLGDDILSPSLRPAPTGASWLSGGPLPAGRASRPTGGLS